MTSKRIVRWSVIIASMLVATGLIVYGHRQHRRFEFPSSMLAKQRALVEAASACREVYTTSVKLVPGHDLRLYRFQCGPAVVSRFPEEMKEDPDLTSGQAEVLLIADVTWFEKKVLWGDVTPYEYKQVVPFQIGSRSAVLIEGSVQGSGGFSDWCVLTRTSRDSVRCIDPPKDLGKVHLRPGGFIGSSHPSIQGQTLFAHAEIYTADDANCCPTGGTLWQRLSLVEDRLKVDSSQRLREGQVPTVHSQSAVQAPKG